MAAARHMHQYGTTREQLAEVAVAARKWALMNPKAWEKEPLTIEQVLNARMVSYPFTVRDCCLVVDGGGAIVLTSAARAKIAEEKARVRAGRGRGDQPRDDLEHARPHGHRRRPNPARRRSRWRRLKPADVDMLSLYDAFTITPILFLEDLGRIP